MNSIREPYFTDLNQVEMRDAVDFNEDGKTDFIGLKCETDEKAFDWTDIFVYLYVNKGSESVLEN